MYKFIKKKCGRTGKIDTWSLECTDIKTLHEHHTKIVSNVIEDGIVDVFSDNKHLSTSYGTAIERFADLHQDSLFNASINLEKKILQGKMKAILNHGHILLRENGSYSVHSAEDEEVESMLSETLIYPHYTIDDIRVKQWQGGNHWYAHIGNLSVTMNGESKWNTQHYAREMAVEYFNTIVK